ncbi:hypothetical protein A0H76_2614 [Hepatospora eriocheir]|uniref:Uncharacterized protein n=1 Tax=Hepatospora eriocheir TaxID=1081669 RepID=A0A1X0QF22_9MICR|nr:hypothetical protein A0H76_2614 [Hepatospora eriocheir]
MILTILTKLVLISTDNNLVGKTVKIKSNGNYLKALPLREGIIGITKNSIDASKWKLNSDNNGHTFYIGLLENENMVISTNNILKTKISIRDLKGKENRKQFQLEKLSDNTYKIKQNGLKGCLTNNTNRIIGRKCDSKDINQTFKIEEVNDDPPIEEKLNDVPIQETKETNPVDIWLNKPLNLESQSGLLTEVNNQLIFGNDVPIKLTIKKIIDSYQFINQVDDKILTVDNNSRLPTFSNEGSLFTIVSKRDNKITMIDVNSKQCLSVGFNNQLILHECNDSSNQEFEIKEATKRSQEYINSLENKNNNNTIKEHYENMDIDSLKEKEKQESLSNHNHSLPPLNDKKEKDSSTAKANIRITKSDNSSPKAHSFSTYKYSNGNKNGSVKRFNRNPSGSRTTTTIKRVSYGKN